MDGCLLPIRSGERPVARYDDAWFASEPSRLDKRLTSIRWPFPERVRVCSAARIPITESFEVSTSTGWVLEVPRKLGPSLAEPRYSSKYSPLSRRPLRGGARRGPR